MASLFSCLVLCCLVHAAHMSKEADGGGGYQSCLDHKGKEVVHGERFFPLGSDPCTQCTCLNGKPQMCIAVFCSPPENCRQYHALSDKCCEFVCLDGDFPPGGKGNNTYADGDGLSTTNLGLRLVASTVTSFLILALLLFMIHRLRQRRLLLMIRRFHARRMDNGTSHLSRRFSEEEDGGSVGYFVGHDQLDFSRYDEPPPPYTLWKPPDIYIPPGEAPPPYDLSVQLTAPASYTPFPTTTTAHHYGSSTVEEQQATSSFMHRSAVAEEQTTTIAVHASPAASADPTTNCSICTAVDMELSNMAAGAVLPPDIRYEDSYAASTSTGLHCTSSAAPVEVQPEVVTAEEAAGTVASNEAVVPSTSACTCSLVSRKGKSKRHTCEERAGRPDPPYPSTSQDNNNLYPDPTAWDSSSSSSPTYDQPTLSPSTSDSSSADFPPQQAPPPSFRTVPGRHRRGDQPERPDFQKTLSNLKKFSLMKRKKKKRRPEISCSFVCQSVAEPLAHGGALEDGIDLTARGQAADERPLEAINPHIGHKLASSGATVRMRPTTINIPGQAYRHVLRRRDGSGSSFMSYADVHCCDSVVTVSGGPIDCASCRRHTASSPDTASRRQHDNRRTGSSRNTDSSRGISRSGSICSETGERRHHRSAGSSPTQPPPRFYASSSVATGLDDRSGARGGRGGGVWVVNSVAEGVGSSRSVGDVSSPLDFRDSVLSSGSSWEACSHL